MPGRLSRIRRAAFLVALLVSAAAYAYSLAAIAGTGSELRSYVSERSVERSAPVSYHSETDTRGDCPDQADAHRVKL
jgi:hypothetical protein